MAIERQDSFTRTAVANGWGTSTDGNVWADQTGQTGSESTDGTHGTVQGSGGSSFLTLGAAVASADANASVRWKVDDSSSTSGILLRFQDSSNYYLFRYDGGGNVSLLKSVAGAHTTVGGFALNPTLGSFYWLRAQVQGSTLQVRAWADGASEPSTWNYTVTDTGLSAAGKVGLYGYCSSGINTYDSFTVSDLAGGGPTTLQGAAAASGGATATAAGTITGGSQVSIGPSTLSVSTKSQTWGGGVPGSPGTATEVASKDANGNGVEVGLIPGYGGMPISTWNPLDGGVAGVEQTSLTTTSPDGLIHWLEQNSGGAFAGSEDVTWTLVEEVPTGTSYRRYYQATGNAPDANGFTWTAWVCIYPGDPTYIFYRFDLHNPTGSAISLASSDSLEIALIAGLQQSDGTWDPANGGYGTLAGGNTVGWPGDGAGGGGWAGQPDYVYIVPTTGKASSIGVVNVLRTSVAGLLGWANPFLQYLTNSNRLKLKLMGDKSSIAAGATETIQGALVFRRNLTATDAQAIAKEVLTVGTPSGPYANYQTDEGCYLFDGTGNSATLSLDMTGVSIRHQPPLKFANWTDSRTPQLRWGGAALVAGTDFAWHYDAPNSTLYVRPTFDVVSGTAGSGQRTNATLIVAAPVSNQTLQAAASASGGASASATGTILGQAVTPPYVPLLPAQRGLQVLHAGQDISLYVMEDEEGDSGLHDLVSGDSIALGGSSASAPAPVALQIESTLAQGAGTSGAAGATATFTTTLGPAAKAKGKAASLTGHDIVRQGSVVIKDAGGNIVFGGTLTKLDDATEGVNVRTVFNCVDYWQGLDRIEVQQVYTGMGDTAIIRALCAAYAPWLDLSLVPASQNYVFASQVCKGTLRECLQAIANTTGFLIYVDVQQRLRYLSPTSAEQANFTLSDTPNGVDSFGYALTSYEVDDNAIINRCYFYGGKNTSPDFVQDLSNQANGTNKLFMLAYTPEDAADGAKHIVLNGVEQAVGSIFDTSAKGKFKSQGGDSDVLINAGQRTAQFDVAPPAPTAGFTLTALYRYQTPLVVVLSDQQSFNFYGSWYDGRISDSNVFDPQTAIQQCKLKLAQNAFGLVSVKLTTYTAGLLAGQVVRLVNSVRGINTTFLIQKVTANPLGAGQFSYDIELGAWNWNLLDLLVENARINNPTDGYAEEDTTVIQAHESVDTATVVTAISHTTHASGQYYSGQPGTYSGFFTVTG